MASDDSVDRSAEAETPVADGGSATGLESAAPVVSDVESSADAVEPVADAPGFADEAESAADVRDSDGAGEGEAEAEAEAEADEPVAGEPVEPKPAPVVDEVLLASVDLARAALLEITPAATVGEVVGSVADEDHVLSLHFASKLAGYPGWHWTVTLARTDTDSEPTVLEVEMLPGESALIAPDWVPWSERLAEYQLAQELAAAQAADEEEGDDDLDDDDEDDAEGDDDLGDDDDDFGDDDDDDDHDLDDDGLDLDNGIDIDDHVTDDDELAGSVEDGFGAAGSEPGGSVDGDADPNGDEDESSDIVSDDDSSDDVDAYADDLDDPHAEGPWSGR